MTKFYLSVEQDEWAALLKSAQRNCRDPRQEARFLLRKALLDERQRDKKQIEVKEPVQA